MATVSDQLRAKKAAGTTATKPRPAGAKPKTSGTKPESKPAEPTEAELAKQKADEKEARKQAAFKKLKERAKVKRAAANEARKEQMTSIQGELEVGAHMFLTRASYYGVEVIIEGFDEVRGRNLVKVRALSTKKGRALDEDAQYTRQVSPKFLSEERPTEKYVPRRGSAQAEPEAEEDEAELEEDDTESEDEAESGDEESEDESEDGDVEGTEDSAEESEDESDDDEADEDSWGEDE